MKLSGKRVHLMSNGSSIPYQLRPNKAVDRELFLSLLGRIAAELELENYQYIGLGGPFLEDFRLIHARLGVNDMVCIEHEEAVHKRQEFNRPVEGIQCVHNTLEDYIDSTDFDKRTLIWFDYTDPRKITEKIERFARTIEEVQDGSMLRITLNANPSSLGSPDPKDITTEAGPIEERSSGKKNMHEWRLEQFQKRMGNLLPNDLKPEDMKFKNFGKSVLRSLYLAVEKEMLSNAKRKIFWLLATHYADGQPMVTATLIVVEAEDNTIEGLVNNWEFYSTPENPLILDMPALSTLERLRMESSDDARTVLGFDLPKSDMGEDPFEAFKSFYRVFPHFSRVEVGP